MRWIPWAVLTGSLMLGACATTPPDFQSADTQTLCVDYAQTLLRGEPIAWPEFKEATSANLEAALAARHADCSPPRRYLRLAMLRLELHQQQQHATIQMLGAPAQYEQAAQPYTPFAPIHWMNSTCGWQANQWVCNGSGN